MMTMLDQHHLVGMAVPPAFVPATMLAEFGARTAGTCENSERLFSKLRASLTVILRRPRVARPSKHGGHQQGRYPSRLIQRCYAPLGSHLQRQRQRRCAGMTAWPVQSASNFSDLLGRVTLRDRPRLSCLRAGRARRVS